MAALRCVVRDRQKCLRVLEIEEKKGFVRALTRIQTRRVEPIRRKTIAKKKKKNGELRTTRKKQRYTPTSTTPLTAAFHSCQPSLQYLPPSCPNDRNDILVILN